jgi:uracil-DNA glycosylase
MDLNDGPVLVSWHPAYILRLRDPALQARARSELIEDLRAASAATPNLPSEPT